jgi:hypothetical protein
MNYFSKDGDEFTSRSQHFRSASKNISYPKSSKQFGLAGITFIQATNDFRITS